MIRLYSVTKGYPGRGPVLEELDLQVSEGEYVVICGASGSGKTTLLRLVTAEERPDQGQVMVAGRNLSRLRASAIPYLRRNVGVIFQDFKLIRDRSVLENVALPLRICGIHGRRMRARCMEVLDWVGLGEQANASCIRLSGGEQQRVALARALVTEPAILLADEPTGNLDPEATAAVLELIRQANVRGLTVVLATHDPRVIRAGHADRVLELSEGDFFREEIYSNSAPAVASPADRILPGVAACQAVPQMG